ncbi:MAG TPA: DEAD/DEAH box helicase [Casimicrobiaceae bacterium]|nr:DEAD/DEAH box helicase [Casimicrobiaceae bacterium]
MTFDSLGLSGALLRAVAEQGYTVPTPIQAQAIPAVLAGGDLMAGAQTGTGKTAGFVLPMLQRLSTTPTHAKSGRKPLRALILTPTRELAAQVEASVKTYGKHLKVTSYALFGGVGFGPQIAQLRRGVDILVATPGRLLDHHHEGRIDFSSVEIFVLDEADRMLDMGFIPDIKRVMALLPSRRQNLLFSATFSDDIKALADRLLDSPQMIQVTPRNSAVEVIEQRVHPVDRHEKARLLAYLIGHNRWEQVLVFTRTKHGADKLVRSLEKDGIRAVALHGNKSQNARTKALADFKKSAVEVLVATDIAARGIDIVELPHVVNYDLPNVPEDYVHRIGRTGRAGAGGEAISLVCIDEHVFLRDIERLLKRPIERKIIAGFEPDPAAVAQPVFASRGRAGQAPSGQRGQQQRRTETSAAPRGQAAPGQGRGRSGNDAAGARDRTAAGQRDRNGNVAGARNGQGPGGRNGNVPGGRNGHAPAARGHATGARDRSATAGRDRNAAGQRDRASPSGARGGTWSPRAPGRGRSTGR